MFQLYRLCLLQLLTALLISSSVAVPTGIWHVDIFRGPTPPPEGGPPLSAGALRDSSYLPVQVGSIVGAYLLFIIATGIALLFVGRRLRRAAQASPRTLAMEMLKPGQHYNFDSLGPSPISPAANNPYGPSPISTVDMKSGPWPSPEKTKTHALWPSIGNKHKKQASMQSSVITFDDSVIEDDRARNQQEMDRLYAAVMEHEEHKSSSRLDLASPQHPPELQHLRSGSATQLQSSQPPRSDTDSPARTITVSPRKQLRPSPITTHSRLSSRSSLGSFGRKRGVRNLPISPPMGSPDLVPEHVGIYGESEPLSPRLYQPGPPPPTPPAGGQAAGVRGPVDESRLSPRHARFPGFNRTPHTAAPTSSTFPGDQTQPLRSENNENIPLRDLAKQKRYPPAPLSLRSPPPQSSTSNNHNARPHQHPLLSAPLPFRNQDRPPSMIKATVLERDFSARAGGRGGPRTGVPPTPYSPYMPFTPLTPMTPSRLITKQERKRMEKEAGRRVATVEDAVLEEGEMWGDGY